MRYRLVALDLDGTVVPRGRPVSERVERAIRVAVDRGVHVTLASGRRFLSLLPYAERFGIRGPLICYGGALLREARGGARLHEQCVPRDLAREVVAAGRDLCLPVHAYVDDDLYVERLTPEHPMYTSLQQVNAQATADLDAFLCEDDRLPHHMAVVTARSREEVVLHLRERFGARLNVTTGHPNLAEIDHPNVSKGAAVRWLAEWLQIPQSEVLAAGDDWNDLTMIAYAGLGVAMASAPLEVRSAARLVAPSADEDGIAQVLEEYVLT